MCPCVWRCGPVFGVVALCSDSFTRASTEPVLLFWFGEEGMYCVLYSRAGTEPVLLFE